MVSFWNLAVADRWPDVAFDLSDRLCEADISDLVNLNSNLDRWV